MDNLGPGEIKVEIEFNPLKSKGVQIFLVFIAGVVLGGFLLLFFNKLEESRKEGVEIVLGQSTDKILTKEEIDAIIKEVQKIAVLPKDEAPVVGTVKDSIFLKNQSFFENAKNGDVVLMYKIAKKAFLYDPRLKKIVNIGPFGEVESQSSDKPADKPSDNSDNSDNEAASASSTPSKTQNLDGVN